MVARFWFSGGFDARAIGCCAADLFLSRPMRSMFMKNLLWLIFGVGVGFVAAHQINKTPQGRRFFEDVDSVAREFTGAVIDGYKSREAELRAAVAEAEETIADLSRRVQD